MDNPVRQLSNYISGLISVQRACKDFNEAEDCSQKTLELSYYCKGQKSCNCYKDISQYLFTFHIRAQEVRNGCQRCAIYLALLPLEEILIRNNYDLTLTEQSMNNEFKRFLRQSSNCFKNSTPFEVFAGLGLFFLHSHTSHSLLN